MFRCSMAQESEPKLILSLAVFCLKAKLTEGDFLSQVPSTAEQYRDFRKVFDCPRLPRRDHDYASYQLLRNTATAFHPSLLVNSFLQSA